MTGVSGDTVVVAGLVPVESEVEALDRDCCSKMMHSGLQ